MLDLAEICSGERAASEGATSLGKEKEAAGICDVEAESGVEEEEERGLADELDLEGPEEEEEEEEGGGEENGMAGGAEEEEAEVPTCPLCADDGWR